MHVSFIYMRLSPVAPASDLSAELSRAENRLGKTFYTRICKTNIWLEFKAGVECFYVIQLRKFKKLHVHGHLELSLRLYIAVGISVLQSCQDCEAALHWNMWGFEDTPHKICSILLLIRICVGSHVWLAMPLSHLDNNFQAALSLVTAWLTADNASG